MLTTCPADNPLKERENESDWACTGVPAGELVGGSVGVTEGPLERVPEDVLERVPVDVPVADDVKVTA